jgi:hypothetical protein
MQSKLDQFVDAAFKLDNKIYNVLDVSVKSLKANIKTDRRTWVLYESELDDLIEKIEFCERSFLPMSIRQSESVSILNNQIINQNNLAERLSKKLEEVFDDISGTPNEADHKKAVSMVNVANSIVNVQMANYKYLTLRES